MSDPRHLAEHAWKDAEAFVDRLEQASRTEMPRQSFYAELTSGLKLSSTALVTALWLSHEEQTEPLSRSGDEVLLSQVDSIAVVPPATSSPTTYWRDDEMSDRNSPRTVRLTSIQRIDAKTTIGITAVFDEPVSPALRQPLTELSQAVLDLAARVYVKQQYEALLHQLGDQDHRDQVIGRLHDGITLSESFAAIAGAIASTTAADRVSLLQWKSTRFHLIATSTQLNVDRRARQVRLLQRLTDNALDHADHLSFIVGAPSDVDTSCRQPLEDYLRESGCREIYIDSVASDEDDSSIVAAIVLERFRVMRDDEHGLATSLSKIDGPAKDAINQSLRRNLVGWDFIASRLSESSRARKLAAGIVIASIAATVLALLPVPLKIPAEGRIMAQQHRRLFAPADGSVIQLPVTNGQSVRAGDPIMVLRSDTLDADQKQLEGELATAQTRLSSLLASRSRSSGDGREKTLSADEQVLRTQIKGLQQRLELVHAQQAKLTLTSPINGQVDRWNLQQTLSARPVQRGQYLVDVYSPKQGWSIELEIPDKNIGYVIAANKNAPCRCTFRLRANPDVVYDGTIDQIAEASQINASGRSVVRVTFPYELTDDTAFRIGSTVNAQVHAGRRSLGFVWFRGLIEWARTQTWI